MPRVTQKRSTSSWVFKWQKTSRTTSTSSRLSRQNLVNQQPGTSPCPGRIPWRPCRAGGTRRASQRSPWWTSCVESYTPWWDTELPSRRKIYSQTELWCCLLIVNCFGILYRLNVKLFRLDLPLYRLSQSDGLYWYVILGKVKLKDHYLMLDLGQCVHEFPRRKKATVHMTS